MGIPINGGSRAYFLAPAGSPQAAQVAEAIADYQARVKEVNGRVEALCAAMEIPPVYGFLLTHNGAKVDNLELAFKSTAQEREVRARLNTVDGKHGIKFRKKTEAYRQMLELMDGCPRLPSYQDVLLQKLTGRPDERAWGGPNTLEHPDGRKVLSVGTTMDMNEWVEKLTAAGFQPISQADYLRVEADVLEAESKAAPVPA